MYVYIFGLYIFNNKLKQNYQHFIHACPHNVAKSNVHLMFIKCSFRYKVLNKITNFIVYIYIYIYKNYTLSKLFIKLQYPTSQIISVLMFVSVYNLLFNFNFIYSFTPNNKKIVIRYLSRVIFGLFVSVLLVYIVIVHFAISLCHIFLSILLKLCPKINFFSDLQLS